MHVVHAPRHILIGRHGKYSLDSIARDICFDEKFDNGEQIYVFFCAVALKVLGKLDGCAFLCRQDFFFLMRHFFRRWNKFLWEFVTFVTRLHFYFIF